MHLKNVLIGSPKAPFSDVLRKFFSRSLYAEIYGVVQQIQQYPCPGEFRKPIRHRLTQLRTNNFWTLDQRARTADEPKKLAAAAKIPGAVT